MRALVLLALARSCAAWTSTSQSNYGASVANIRLQQNGTTTAPGPDGSPQEIYWQQLLGYLWTFPEDSDDKAGLGGGMGTRGDNARL